MEIVCFISNFGSIFDKIDILSIMYRIQGPFLTKLINKRVFLKPFCIVSFIEPYRFYHLKKHLSNRFYRALINSKIIYQPNDMSHLLILQEFDAHKK